MDKQLILKIAQEEILEEKKRILINKQKERLKWPWYKKLFPYRIKIIDLRREYDRD